jgi:UPF0716 protein FxsA
MRNWAASGKRSGLTKDCKWRSDRDPRPKTVPLLTFLIGSIPLFPFVFFLFVAVPIIEIFLLIKVGSAIGALATIAIVILTAFIGTRMLKIQGLSTLNLARSKMASGQVPATEMAEGLALAVGGALLLTPGFVTDAIGFACLIPYTRRLLIKYAGRNVRVAGVAGYHSTRASSARSPRNATHGRNEDVIEGEFERKDD